MIKALELKNFKSIREMNIDLAPLTIFVGPNGAGKSSILESIALMAQFAKTHGRISDSLKGELIDFEDLKTIFPKGHELLHMNLSFGANLNREESMNLVQKEYELFKIRKESVSAISRYLSRLRYVTRKAFAASKKEVSFKYRHSFNGKASYNSDSFWIENCLLIRQIISQNDHRSFPTGLNLKSSTGNEMTFLPSFKIFDLESFLLEHVSSFLRSQIP